WCDRRDPDPGPRPGPGHPRAAWHRARGRSPLRHVDPGPRQPDRQAVPASSHRSAVLSLCAPASIPARRLRRACGEISAGSGHLLRRRGRGRAGHDLGAADERSDLVRLAVYTVEEIPAHELGNSSFLVADPDSGLGFVIDPLRDIERYLHAASRLHIRLSHSLDTHLHNDFVSGRRELAVEAGANIEELNPGRDLAIGGMTVQAIHTPGHTPEHKSYLLSEGGRLRALFSG